MDVLILGGGVAGVAAALAAAGVGARTALVRRGPGATALCAGGWTGMPPAGLSAALAAADLPLDLRAAALPHPDGRVLRYDAAPAGHGGAQLMTDSPHAPPAPPAPGMPVAGERVLVCGIAGLPSFHAAALAALWADAGALPDGLLAAVSLSLADTPADGWSAAALAARLEREPQLLADPLAAAVRRLDAARVIVPAVLGLDAHGRVHGAVEAGAGVPVGEALGVAPSLPGWRLDRALLRALEDAGVAVISGPVTDRATADGAVPVVTVATAAGNVVLRSTAMVLATGRFIGGGVTAASRFIESALHIELAIDGVPGRNIVPAESLALTRADRTASQPVLGIGVRTDADGRPVTARGDVVFRNVFAAGSIRAGEATAVLGLGNAASDGWRAGTHAAAAAASA